MKNALPTYTIAEKLEMLDPERCDKKMSRHYQMMDSRELVNQLLSMTSKGQPVFEVRDINFKKSRKQNTVGGGVHTVRLKTIKAYDINGEMLHPEVVIMNSYDGSSPLKVYVGIFRIICSNGLVVALKDFGQTKIRHMGTPAEAAFDIAKGFAKNISKVVEMQTKLTETKMTKPQIIEFAKQAASLRWETIAEDADYTDLYKSERPEDSSNSVWTVYNRIQEKMMKGGVKIAGMKRTAKPITDAAKDIWVNESLFELAMSYVETAEVPDLVEELV